MKCPAFIFLLTTKQQDVHLPYQIQRSTDFSKTKLAPSWLLCLVCFYGPLVSSLLSYSLFNFILNSTLGKHFLIFQGKKPISEWFTDQCTDQSIRGRVGFEPGMVAPQPLHAPQHHSFLCHSAFLPSVRWDACFLSADFPLAFSVRLWIPPAHLLCLSGNLRSLRKIGTCM